MYSMLPSVNVENYTSLLPIVIHFVSMVLLLLLRSKEWYWIRIDKNGHICFIDEFCGTTLSFSSRTVMLPIYLSYIAFTMLHYLPSIENFSRTLVLNELCHRSFLHLLNWYVNFIFESDCDLFKIACFPTESKSEFKKSNQ